MKRFVAFAGLALAAFAWARAQAVQRIVIIGDSTVMSYAASKYPMAGWGQVLGLYFKPGTVTVVNKAVGGRSSKSFATLGQWDGTLAELQAGDVLLIQFGHNDRSFSDTVRYADTATYRKYLTKYVAEARAKGAHPVFVTPMNMNTWSSAGGRRVFTEGANDYRGAMIRAGADLKVPVLDLELKSKQLMDSASTAWLAKFHFLGLDAGEYPNYSTGIADGTHFQEMGALANARMVSEEIARQPNDSILKLLAPHLAPTYAVTVKSTLPGGGDTLTRSTRLPAGAAVTVKIKPAKGRTFKHWLDEKGVVRTREKRLTYVQDASDHAFVALYEGVTVEAPRKASRPVGLRPRQNGAAWEIASDREAGEVVVRDVRGLVVRRAASLGPGGCLGLEGLAAGSYIASSEALGSNVRFTVR
jgi:lysophospholipase L1-like esterase